MSQGIPLKLVVVGDGAVGKTCTLISYATGKFPEEYIPTIFDNYSVKITVDNKKINLGLWDTAGQEEYSKIRPLAYPNTDIFLIVFSVDDKSSFENAYKKWYPELKANIPQASLLFVGTKIDLRDEQKSCISTAEATKMAGDLGLQYFECSAKTGQGLKELFELAVKIGLAQSKSTSKRLQADKQQNKDSSCQLI